MNETKIRLRSLPTVLGGTVLIFVATALLLWIGLARPVGHPAVGAQPAAVVVSSHSAAPINAQAAIAVVGDPQAEIQRRISQATGNTCFITAFVNRILVSGDELDKQITAAGGDDRWLEKGEKWVGPDTSAVLAAFGASWAGQRRDSTTEIWIQVSGSSGPNVGLQLLRSTTPAGHTVWTVGDRLAPSTECD